MFLVRFRVKSVGLIELRLQSQHVHYLYGIKQVILRWEL